MDFNRANLMVGDPVVIGSISDRSAYGSKRNPEMYRDAIQAEPPPVSPSGASDALNYAESLSRQLAGVLNDMSVHLNAVSRRVAETPAQPDPKCAVPGTSPYFSELQKHLYDIECSIRHLRNLDDQLDL